MGAVVVLRQHCSLRPDAAPTTPVSALAAWAMLPDVYCRGECALTVFQEVANLNICAVCDELKLIRI